MNPQMAPNMNAVDKQRLALHYTFPGRWLWARRFLLHRLTRTFECYHPVFVHGEQLASGQRSCEDRWRMIDRVLEEQRPASLLDLGCAEGYFVRKAATERKVLSLGIDADIRRLSVASDACLLDEVSGCSFMHAHMDVDFIGKLQKFDIVLFLSVLHHIMYADGIAYSLEIMKAIHEKTGKCLVFDMGQSNEIEHSWAPLLPDMGADPTEWIIGFLRRAGFSAVEILGQADSYRGTSQRIVFAARP